MVSEKLKEFNELVDEALLFQRANTFIRWDQATGAPSGGSEDRGALIAKLSGKYFECITCEKTRELIKYLDEHKDELDEISKATVRDLKKYNDSFLKVPVKFMEEYSKFRAHSEVTWEKAKQTDDFELFAPVLEKMLGYSKQLLEYRGFTSHPYNTLLDDYEEDLTIEKLDIFFETVKNTIVDLLKRIKESDFNFDASFMNRPIPKAKQQEFSEYLLDVLGFDRTRARLCESEHPFTTDVTKNDVRITTHYYEDKILSSMYSVIHEVGHALYELNVADELKDTFLSGGVSTGIHESQSRFYENVIGRSRSFWKLIYPKFREIFKDEFSDISEEQFYIASNLVNTSNLIRTEADELTYSLHIIIRYEIEREIFSRDITADEIRNLWNKKYEEYFGMTPKNDTEGVLQDTHWSFGGFGYFPSYSLGSANAAMITNYLNKENDVDKAILNNDIPSITKYLTDKIHKYGGLIKPEDLLIKSFGEGFNAQYYVDYLKNKFEDIYGL